MVLVVQVVPVVQQAQMALQVHLLLQQVHPEYLKLVVHQAQMVLQVLMLLLQVLQAPLELQAPQVQTV